MLSHSPPETKVSIKRRMSDPDPPCKDDEPKFLGTSTRGRNQLSLTDAWGLTRSDDIGPENSFKRARIAKNPKKEAKPAKGSSTRAAQPIKIPTLSSSIGSPTPSHSSLFSVESSWDNSELSDMFNDLDFGFDPSLFPLEVSPVHGLHPSWLEPLKTVLILPQIISLHQQLGPNYLGYDYKRGEKPLQCQAEISPPPQDLYNWSRLTPLDRVKVVILGSAPHFQPAQAHGLAFSQPTTCARISGTIRNIHRELAYEYPDKFVRPHHGSLVSWAQAGVLLLNIVQTTQRDDQKAHDKLGWQEFTAKILEIVSRDGGSSYTNSNQRGTSKGIVFIGWGEEATQLINSVGVLSSNRHHQILTSPGGPTPLLSSNRGFFKSNHFQMANQFLSATYGPKHTIDWWDLQPLDPYSVSL
ncbi:hypothetical protein PTTG_08385 [Puccinia triticina 1-1 BBBD Race 1]|uniref:UDG domain-containing protein n=1 Tax=Puccinia triticina (isolate 1-1 / race 1 (BBBD)) TaxID=630390 RepID=A0A0C4F5I5_PUCT1|nr:hypothetical protein PTTG_08385 [Puccinia triticina 1-1 BBBD Race 1]